MKDAHESKVRKYRSAVMKHLIHVRGIRFCAMLTALVAFGLVGASHHEEPTRTSTVTAAECQQGLGCDDTSWGG
jgi:hypothetical protein